MGNEHYRVAELGALVGDPARASMLTELMAGRALTAGELALVAASRPKLQAHTCASSPTPT